MLENFLGDTGGRRGREREQRRQEAASEAPDDGDPDWLEDDGAEAEDAPSTDDEPAASTDRERPDADELGEEEVVDDLYHRIESLEDDLDRTSSEMGAVRDSQEHVAEQVDEVNDTVRQLLGIYDLLTDDVNPFTGEGETEGGFGVFGEQEDGGFGLADREPADGADDDTVSFEDLKAAIDEAAAAEADRDSGGQRITIEELGEPVDGGPTEPDDDSRVEVQATSDVGADDAVGTDDGATGSKDGTTGSEDGATGSDADEDAAVTLTALADTYATDVIVFEWLTELVRTAGPAATLRAIAYYHEIGWIGADVRAHLEATLGGPDLDIGVDPEATPEELTAEDHADSYTYIMKLEEIHETDAEVSP